MITGFGVNLWTLFVTMIDVYLRSLLTHSGVCTFNAGLVDVRWGLSGALSLVAL